MDTLGGLPRRRRPARAAVEERTTTARRSQYRRHRTPTRRCSTSSTRWAPSSATRAPTRRSRIGEASSSRRSRRQMARVTGAMSAAFDIAQKHPEAKIPRTSTYWDETLDTIAQDRAGARAPRGHSPRARGARDRAARHDLLAATRTSRTRSRTTRTTSTAPPFNVTTNEHERDEDAGRPDAARHRQEPQRAVPLPRAHQRHDGRHRVQQAGRVVHAKARSGSA